METSAHTVTVMEYRRLCSVFFTFNTSLAAVFRRRCSLSNSVAGNPNKMLLLESIHDVTKAWTRFSHCSWLRKIYHMWAEFVNSLSVVVRRFKHYILSLRLVSIYIYDLLNKRNEILSNCRHVNKHLLCNFKAIPPDN